MKPDRIFIVRHGQSTGNVNKEVYKDTPDYALTLTEKGQQQAFEVGTKIAAITGIHTPIQFYVSPFWRTRQTYAGIRQSFPDNNAVRYYEDPRIREQEWGQNMESREGYKQKVEEYRDSYGHFYYRFRDGGESCADVFDRVSDFMGTMFRDFEKRDYPKNVVIVTHGMTMRLFLMRWFHCSVEEFESWKNPDNCNYYLLERGHGAKGGRYELKTPLRKHALGHNFQFAPVVFGDPLFPVAHKLPYENQPRHSAHQP